MKDNDTEGPRPKRTKFEIPKALGIIIGGRSDDDLERYVSALEFASVEEVVKHTHLPAVLQSQEDDVPNMVQNMEKMAKKVEEHGKLHALQQNLQLFKQLEFISEKRKENMSNTITYLSENFNFMSKTALKELMRVGWSVYRYPALGQVKLNWSQAKLVIPAAARLFDTKVEANESLPANVIRAQMSRLNAPCLRVSLKLPDQRPGDGDGLPKVRVTELHGLYLDDRKVDNLQEHMLFRKLYPSEFAFLEGDLNENIEMRSRLIGYDTQEAPRDQDHGRCRVPQHFWHEGQEFLVQKLEDLRGELVDDQARILADCYGIDLYGRMLLDIRAVYDAEADEQPEPTLGRLQMAKEAIRTGFAFPTNHYLVTNDLWQAFQEAIRQKKGGFGSDLPFVHPSKCRKERYEIELRASRERRQKYAE